MGPIISAAPPVNVPFEDPTPNVTPYHLSIDLQKRGYRWEQMEFYQWSNMDELLLYWIFRVIELNKHINLALQQPRHRHSSHLPDKLKMRSEVIFDRVSTINAFVVMVLCMIRQEKWPYYFEEKARTKKINFYIKKDWVRKRELKSLNLRSVIESIYFMDLNIVLETSINFFNKLFLKYFSLALLDKICIEVKLVFA